MSADDKLSILVVEDENVVAMDLASCLEKLGYTVAGVADSGEEAIAIARRERPDLVLMDIHLRGAMDGIDAAQAIQTELLIPVVYLTAYSDEATLARARITHPFGYVLKPFEDREIEVAIQMAMFRHGMERALRTSERRLDAILEAIGDAVIATNAEMRITFLNQAAEALLGWSSERAQGRLLSDVLRGSRQPDGVFHLTRDGNVIPVELVESAVLDATDEPIGYVTIARDLSERLRAQDAHDREIVERAARAAAVRESERVQLKSDISLVLADMTQATDLATSLRRVGDLIVGSIASWAIIHIEDGSSSLEVIAHAHPAERADAEALLRRSPDIAASHASTVLRTGEAQLIESVSDEALVAPAHLALFRELGVTSSVCVPLQARQRVVGTLTLLSIAPSQRYSRSDVAFAQQIADRVALATDNLRLYLEAQDATIAAERLYEAEQRTRAEAEALFRIADALAQAQLDREALVQRVTDEATALVGAQFGAFFYNVVADDGEAYLLYTLSGAPRSAFEHLGLPRNTPIFGPTFQGHGVVRIDDVRKDPRYGTMAPHHGMPKGHLPVTSYLAVPVVSRSGAVIGGLFFGHPEAGRFTEEHERMAKALAAHAAVAMDNAQLFSAMREAEERQSKLVRELERAVRFSEMFVGILGHDLRNPLSGITTAASLVLGRADSERIATPVRRILSSAERMSRMIDQILDFTRVRLGRGIPLARKNVDLGVVCRQVLDELKGEGEGRPEVHLVLRGDAVGNWDPDRLAQLVSNLGGNALQHRARASQVVVSVDGTMRDRITLEVHNEGVIPADVVPVLFEPMRGSEPRKRAGASGLGLGLYISQQIARAHGGVIRVTSVPSSGTRFVAELPREAPGESEHVFSPTTEGDSE